MRIKKFPNERQLDMMDCGPACLKIIAKYYGKYYSLQYLRDKCSLTKEGVSLLDIGHAAEEIGFHTLSLKCTIEDLIHKIPVPIIVHWDNSHFVVVYNIKIRHRILPRNIKDDDYKIFVSDPSKGYVCYNRTEFTAKWLKGSGEKGVLMALEPQASFYESKDTERQDRKRTFANFIGYFTPYKKNFANLLFVMLVVTVIQGLLPFISKAVIDVGILSGDLTFINTMLVANLSLIVTILFSNVVRDWILLHVTSRLNIALISDYLIKLMRLPITFFENKMTGDILQRAQDHERIRSFLMNNSLNMLFSTLTFLVFGVVMFFFNPNIFLIFCIGSAIYVTWVMGFLNFRKKLDWEYFELVSKNQSYWIETISNIQDIKINNFEKQKRWNWESIQAKMYHVNIRLTNLNNTQNTGAQFIDSLKTCLLHFIVRRQ